MHCWSGLMFGREVSLPMLVRKSVLWTTGIHGTLHSDRSSSCSGDHQTRPWDCIVRTSRFGGAKFKPLRPFFGKPWARIARTPAIPRAGNVYGTKSSANAAGVQRKSVPSFIPWSGALLQPLPDTGAPNDRAVQCLRTKNNNGRGFVFIAHFGLKSVTLFTAFQFRLDYLPQTFVASYFLVCWRLRSREAMFLAFCRVVSHFCSDVSRKPGWNAKFVFEYTRPVAWARNCTWPFSQFVIW